MQPHYICLSIGTSSKSTKLVHGGVRYLQKAVFELDYEQYKLVREALRERRVFLQTAPYLSHMLPIMLPIYKCVIISDPPFSTQIRLCHLSTPPVITVTDEQSGTGKFRTTGPAANYTTSLLARKTWNPRTSCPRARLSNSSPCSRAMGSSVPWSIMTVCPISISLYSYPHHPQANTTTPA